MHFKMQSPTLAHKLAFFERLEALNEEDADDDYGKNEREAEYREKSRAFLNRRKSKEEVAPRPVHSRGLNGVNDTPTRNPGFLPERRTASEFTPGPTTETDQPTVIKATPLLQKAVTAAQDSANSRTEHQGGGSFVEDTPVANVAKAKNLRSLQRGSTYPGPSPLRVEQSPSASSVMRKRKRNTSPTLKVVPESEQILRGLAFYYIPDNDVAPLRKIRINRAREHGAQWIRTLDGATHVVVDKNLSYKDIEKILTKADGSVPVVVNEDYPIDCISFHNILNPDQQRYKVPGCPLPADNDAVSPREAQQQSQHSDRSLVVQKNPDRMDPKPSRVTPPRSEESSLRSAGNGQPKIATASEIFEEPADIEKEGDTIPQTAASTTSNLSASHSSNGPTSNPSDGSKVGEKSQRKDGVNDELSEYIALVQQYKDLPLDSDEEDLQSATKDPHDSASDAEGTSDSDSASSHARKTLRSKKGAKSGGKAMAFEERFACYQGGTKDSALTSGSTSPNARTIEILQAMCDYYSRTNDHWRTTAYRKAITTLRRQPAKITTAAEAAALPAIGPRLAAKIAEIAATDRLRRLEYAADDPLAPVLETFLGIYDVGLATATRWIAQGHRSLADLLARATAPGLTANQRLGIERFDDLNARIPRAEVECIAARVARAAAALDPAVELLVGGSYRRGAESSGDVDFIVTRKGTRAAAELAPFLERLVGRLTAEGFLVAALATHRQRGSASRAGSGSKWHGCCVLSEREGRAVLGDDFKPRWRRIDFLLVPETEYGAALIYFTGNDIFNRSLRLLASKKGMRLNQRGLYKEVMRGPNRAKVTEGELVEGRDEKRIFEILGVPWWEPSKRWC